MENVEYRQKTEKHYEYEREGYVAMLARIANTNEVAVLDVPVGRSREGIAEGVFEVAGKMGLTYYIHTNAWAEQKKVHVWFDRKAWESAHVDYCRLCCKAEAREEVDDG